VDVIFCRNVLIYFAPPTIRRVLERFSRLLASGGWLFVASCETVLVRRPAFVPVAAEGVTAFRKAPPEESPLRVFSAALADGDSFLDGGVFFREEERPFGSGGEEAEPFSVLAGEAGGRCLRRFPSVFGEGLPELADAFGGEFAEGLPFNGGDGVASVGDVPSASSGGSPEDAAYDAFRRGNWEEAERLLEPLAAHSASARRLLVRLEADRGRHDRALDLCRQALDREKEDPVLFYLLSLIHQERGEDDEAHRRFGGPFISIRTSWRPIIPSVSSPFGRTDRGGSATLPQCFDAPRGRPRGRAGTRDGGHVRPGASRSNASFEPVGGCFGRTVPVVHREERTGLYPLA
jgi:chemotaxis protein methyltransferase CheR